MKYEIHELANLFPMLREKEYEQLRDDIKTNGLLFPIVLYNDKILDGRNRNRACEELGITPRTEEYKGNDPLGYVLAVNLHRRHLDESQRAMIGATLATMRQGERNDKPFANLRKVSQKEAGRIVNVSPRLVCYAKKVMEEGTEEEIDSVRNGQKSVSTIVSIIKKRTESQKPVKGQKQTQNKSQEKGQNETDSETIETTPVLPTTFCQPNMDSTESTTPLPSDDSTEDIVRSWLDSSAKLKRLLDLFEETMNSEQEKQGLYKTIERWLKMRVNM